MLSSSGCMWLRELDEEEEKSGDLGNRWFHTQLATRASWWCLSGLDVVRGGCCKLWF